jgi:hypothetical protein
MKMQYKTCEIHSGTEWDDNIFTRSSTKRIRIELKSDAKHNTKMIFLKVQ